jgi:uncharacterized SAM-binding protein YcdF (DUF218 family)
MAPAVARRRFRLGRALLVLVAVAVVAWLVACVLVVQYPRINQVSHADAIVVIGPADDYRLAEATTLLQAGVSHRVIVSRPPTTYLGALEFCAHPPAHAEATCFSPSPATTRGEAEEVARLASANHWTSVIVVTSKYHVSRARMIFDRCLDGQVDVVSAHQTITPLRWAYEYAYQSAGYVRAFLQSGC